MLTAYPCATVTLLPCTGFGMGLICLGQGRNAPGLADLHLEDRLRWGCMCSCVHVQQQE